MSKPIGVILLNLGGPDSPETVRPFLRNLFLDPEILPVPMGRWLRPALAWLISWARAEKSRALYERIGGRSPLLEITLAQAAGLERELRARGEEWAAVVAMRYWHPRAREAVAALVARGVERAVALPLYPQFSKATTGSSLRELEQVVAAGSRLDLTAVRSWHDDPGYLDALADTAREGLAQFAADRRERIQVLFSAHSLPMSLVDGGDPYPKEVAVTVAGVVRRLGGLDGRWRLAYQSRVGPVRWLGPSTPSVIEELAREGHTEMLVVPVSFVSDNIETLEEIDLRYREVAVRVGVKEFRRAPALNDRSAFLSALASIVVAAAASKT